MCTHSVCAFEHYIVTLVFSVMSLFVLQVAEYIANAVAAGLTVKGDYTLRSTVPTPLA